MALFTVFEFASPSARFPYLCDSWYWLGQTELKAVVIDLIDNLLLVEISVRAYLILNADALHVVNFSSRELVRILNWTLANLLIQNGHVDSLLDCFFVGCCVEMFVSLISVLISLYKRFKSVISVTEST